MALEMIGDKLAIIPLEDPDKVGRIYVPAQAKQRIDQGIVKYKGPEVKEIFVGAHVLFSGYDGTKVSLEGEGVLFIMHEKNIQCIIDEDDPMMVFPLQKVLAFITEAETEVLRTAAVGIVPGPLIERYTELLRTKFQDHFIADGLSF